MRCQHQIVIARGNCQISNGNRWKMVAFKLCPVFSTINRDPKSKLRSQKEQIRLDQILLDHMSVSTDAFGVLSACERRPGLTVISCFEDIRRHVAKGMSIKRRIRGAGVEVARLHPADPRIFWQTGNIADD